MSGRERLDVRYNIFLSERQEEGMRRIAARTGLKKTKIIRRAIDVYLRVDRHKEEMRRYVEERG